LPALLLHTINIAIDFALLNLFVDHDITLYHLFNREVDLIPHGVYHEATVVLPSLVSEHSASLFAFISFSPCGSNTDNGYCCRDDIKW